MKIRLWAIGVCAVVSLSAADTQPASIKVTPATATLHAGAKPATFKAVESGVTPAATTFAWSLAAPAGSTGSLGSIDSKGVYTPPPVPPSPNTVTVKAADSAHNLSGTATITLLDPVPAISKLSSSSINTGLAYTIDVIGSGFMPSYKVMLDTTAANATFISSTDIQIKGTSTAAAGTKIAVTVVDPATNGATSNAVSLTVQPPVTVSLSPDGRSVRCGATLPLSWQVHNNSNQAVTWQVNGIPNGNSTVGTVTSTTSSSGATTVTYNAPADLPMSATVTLTTGGAAPVANISVKITATSAADPAASANINVNLLNAVPVITSVTPNPAAPGAGTVIVKGTGFASGAIVYFAGAPLSTHFDSDTQLTATGALPMPVGRIAAVKVANPAPGAATSAPVAVPVRLASEKMPYSDAVRFLGMASFGPTPESVAHLQAIGRDAWLAEQYAIPASAWPDPLTPNEGIGRLQTSFFNIALNGPDQLRQRVAFALAQIMVVSGNKNVHFAEMVNYQRLLGDSAFGNYRDLLGKMTLDPSMGYYLDMVNNDKADPKKNTVANENYAREVMQLFSLGLVQLNLDGTPIPGAAPEYTQDTVTQMAKVMTGWTYPPEPGFASQWKNPPYYFAPMVAFEEHHDTTQKNISLPIPCTIPVGGTAATDLNQALDCIAKQSNVAPFMSYRLIQRLVKSNPTPKYVSDVAAVFNSSHGNLQQVVNAILTHSEALLPASSPTDTGKLAEPVLYATSLLRALGATVTNADGVNGQSTGMGQNVLEPASVFSYFSPFYRVMGQPAPEFQVLNAATSIGRANFVWKAITNGISGNVKVNLGNLQDLAALDPNTLVEAINQALYHGDMTTTEKGYILGAAKGSATSAAANVRSALYAAAAAPQYEVQY